MKQNLALLSGPIAFGAAAFLLTGTFQQSSALALSCALWMALWWIFRPVSIYVTAFIPIIVNSLFNLIPMNHVISQYFSEIAVLLLGSDLICLTWTTTGLDKRISVRALCSIGTSMKSQIFVWFLASTALSVFLPNVVVAAIFCPIAVAMLHFTGEKDISTSQTAIPILLAIGWGSGIGGLGSPIGSPANLVAIQYMEQLTGHEFMYIQWIGRFVPILFVLFLVNLFFLWHLDMPVKSFRGTREEFRKMYDELGPMRTGEMWCFWIFVLAIVLAFIRPLYAATLPGLKPSYVFLILGMLLFVLRDEENREILTWNFAEKNAMWGIMIMASSGLALGTMIIETGAVAKMAQLLGSLQLSGGFATLFIFCAFACFMSEISSNTASASISIPVVIGITSSLSLNPIPYILGTIAAANCAYILPISTRAIPIGYGLSASAQIRYGTVLSLLTVILITLLCTAFMAFVPLFSEL